MTFRGPQALTDTLENVLAALGLSVNHVAECFAPRDTAYKLLLESEDAQPGPQHENLHRRQKASRDGCSALHKRTSERFS
jgi:hypothetical protein